MKTLFTLIILVVLTSCGTQKIISYEYTSVTRGYRLSIKVTEETTTITENKGTSQPHSENTITNSELWKSLQKGSEKIELKKISELESPTNKRQIDAAMFSKLILTTADSTYTSSSFDNGHPPEMLKIVVDSLANLKK